MKRTKLRFLGIFAASASLAFLLGLARTAQAGNVYTVAGGGCPQLPGYWSFICTIPAGTNFSAVGGLAHSYFDFATQGEGKIINLTLRKRTWAGANYADYHQSYQPPGGPVEIYLAPSLVNVSYSVWDYIEARFDNTGLPIGVGVKAKD